MNLTINGSSSFITGALTVHDLLIKLGYQGPHFAVALNLECVPRHAFQSTALKENDVIEILSPMQGG